MCVYVLACLLILGSAMLMWNHRAAHAPISTAFKPGDRSNTGLVPSGGMVASTSPSPGVESGVPGSGINGLPDTAPSTVARDQSDSAAAGLIVVHVAGAVKSPGVYHLKKGDRVVDAIEAARGPADDAVVDALNLATRLEDGQKIHVPSKKDIQQGNTAGAGSSGAQWGSPPKVNLNLATREQLDTLPGIGPGLASAIIEYRSRAGGFKAPEDLMKVGGIGAKTFARLKPLVVVD